MAIEDSRVTAVTVAHNSSDVLETMVRSLPTDIPLVIVDNASNDRSVATAKKWRPDATVHLNAVGLGYGNGMNVALAHIETEFAVMINPDTVLHPGAIDSMIETADVYDTAALVGPNVLNPDGSIEISYDVAVHKRKAYGKRTSETVAEGHISTESLSGAVVLARMSCLRDVGFFDPAFFLYFEDEDMCMVLRKAGYELIFDPHAVLTHVGGGSVPETPAYHWEKYWHTSWSGLYYERKHHGIMSMLRVLIGDAPKFALKSIGYALCLNREKARRDAARCFGMMAFVLGIKASRVVKN